MQGAAGGHTCTCAPHAHVHTDTCTCTHDALLLTCSIQSRTMGKVAAPVALCCVLMHCLLHPPPHPPSPPHPDPPCPPHPLTPPPPPHPTLPPQDVQLGDVELPGQYLSGVEVNPDSIIYLEGIGSDVAIVRRNASSFRRLSLLCSDGHTRHMLVQVRGGVVRVEGGGV